MFEKILDRRNQIYFVFILVFIMLFFRLAILTVVDGEYYRELSINKRLKQIPVVAKRGEIYDVNDQLLAGNVPAFTVHLLNNEVTSKDFNDVAVKIMDILNEKEERHIAFPIQIRGDVYFYTYDEEVRNWLRDNAYQEDMTAEEVFEAIREREQISDELDRYSAQKFMIFKGVSPPILVKDMQFKPEREKASFLEMYGIDEGTDAYEAFQILRKKYKIGETYSDEDAYNILILKHALRQKGYRKYEPVKIANSIRKETAILVEEMGMELPGIKVEVEPVRIYPYSEQAAHVLGYMGKISTEREITKYVDDNGYMANELIGKIGIEGKYELDLKGQNGSKYIEVDAYGRLVREVDDTNIGIEQELSKSGNDVKLTLDIELQEATSMYLENALRSIREGVVYESPWGDYRYSKQFEKAETGAVVVVDVKTGEVRALVNYPSYDLNLFATGISYADYKSLLPENPRNPLAPRPLYNIATLTAVQPGSTYKPITGFAAVEEGFSPEAKLYDGGAIITADGTSRACWLWNKNHGSHGSINLVQALEVSCNYYFFDVSNGYDYYKDKPLGIAMNAERLIEHTRTFGLDEATGIEISETVMGVPDPERKKKTLLKNMRRKLLAIAEDYFPAEVVNDEEKLEALILDIQALADDNPSRGALISKLIELGSNEDYRVTENLADIIKYSYFNQMKWFEGDTFNLSIGQGSHQYTPVQIARYISAVANDGYLNKLTMVKEVDGVPVEREPAEYINDKGIMAYLREGMYQVAHGSRGTARSTFRDFPINVGAKTGTAEKDGKLPPEKEEEYLKEYLPKIAPSLDYEEVELEAYRILRERNDELAELELKLASETDEEEKIKIDKKIKNYFYGDFLYKGSAMRAAIKLMTEDAVTDDDLNAYKEDYDNFTWFVSFAPYEDPEIAVVVLIPQGGSGGFAGPIVKDIYGKYFDLMPPSEEDVVN